MLCGQWAESTQAEWVWLQSQTAAREYRRDKSQTSDFVQNMVARQRKDYASEIHHLVGVAGWDKGVWSMNRLTSRFHFSREFDESSDKVLRGAPDLTSGD